MATPSLQFEAERLGIVRKEPDISWMNDVLLEVPNPVAYRRRARFWRAFSATACLVIIACGLAAISH